MRSTPGAGACRFKDAGYLARKRLAIFEAVGNDS
jgi:hypothetical protein